MSRENLMIIIKTTHKNDFSVFTFAATIKTRSSYNKIYFQGVVRLEKN